MIYICRAILFIAALWLRAYMRWGSVFCCAQRSAGSLMMRKHYRLYCYWDLLNKDVHSSKLLSGQKKVNRCLPWTIYKRWMAPVMSHTCFEPHRSFKIGVLVIVGFLSYCLVFASDSEMNIF